MAATDDVYLNQPIQIKLEHDADDLSGAALSIRYVKPSGTSGTWANATDDGTYLVKDLPGGELDEVGDWLLQCYVTESGETDPTPGSPAYLRVLPLPT